MTKVEDLIGRRFGKLVVVRLVGKDKHYNKIWECKCDCGNVVTVRQGHLRSGHMTSCGCNKNLLKSLVGQRFGHLVVQERADDYVCPSNNKKYVQWKCICDCGKSVIVVGSNLLNHSTVSCGCMKPHAFQDLSGQVFGKLTVLRQVDSYINPSGRKLIRYECQCECGQHVFELANTLRSGDVTSCGCSINSKGEHIVMQVLQEYGLDYELHKSFEDCLSDIGHRLNFDFFVPFLNLLIECNGLQHYEPIDFFGGVERFQTQQRNDLLKLKYAESKGFLYLVLDCRRKNLSNIGNVLHDFVRKHWVRNNNLH